MTRRAAPLALTQGDPSGIGPELALKAFGARKELDLPAFFVLGDPAFYARVAQALGLDAPVAETGPRESAAVFSSALPVVPLGRAVRGPAGAPDPADASATILSIERAVDCVARGEARAVVTSPIAKNVLYAAGFEHPGHTEFLGALAERFYHAKARPVMMLWAKELAVVPVTIHVAPSIITDRSPGRPAKAARTAAEARARMSSG